MLDIMVQTIRNYDRVIVWTDLFEKNQPCLLAPTNKIDKKWFILIVTTSVLQKIPNKALSNMHVTLTGGDA